MEAAALNYINHHFATGPLPQKTIGRLLDKVLPKARILIIEGISGSGKDTFQKHLKEELSNRDLDVYDYSEGELLQSWKQLQIGGILAVRLRFMRLFLKYMKEVLVQNKNAIFLLNRFHLSTYGSTITRMPKLTDDYDKMIATLKKLPVHVFVLQLDENEIQQRSTHPERSAAWRNHRKEIIQKEGFRDTLERHLWQQGLTAELAEKQDLPYSLVKVSYAPKMQRNKSALDIQSATPPGRKLKEPSTQVWKPKTFTTA